ncbi:MAG: 16S rRNA (uracil(1498)-N(3))-methyltransferase [Beutenbergiaceae bacterium]
MTAPVFISDPGSLTGLSPGRTWTLRGPEARHAASVQRLRPGEAIEIVDGDGVRLRGRVAAAVPGEVQVEVIDLHAEPAAQQRFVLVQALAKGGRDEMAVEAATELGVDAIRPWQSQRSVVQWRGDKAAKGEHRWRALVHAAAKVARRARLPRVDPFVRGEELVDVVADAVRAGAVVLLLHEQAATPMSTAPVDAAGEVMVIVGPEGGISDDEVRVLVAAGARCVLMGSNVLRSSTAGPAALAVLAQRVGRWG